MKRQYNKQEIADLLDKFMAGETSLDEENVLAQYFRTHEVNSEWKEYKEMFALFDNGKVDVESGSVLTGKSKTVPLRWIMTGIAACIILLIGFSLLIEKEDSANEKPVVTEVIEQEAIEQSTTQSATQPIFEEKQEATLADAQSTPQPAKKRRKAIKKQSIPIEEPLLAEAEPVQEDRKLEYQAVAPPAPTLNKDLHPHLLAAAQAQDIRSKGERLSQEVALLIEQ